jgi:hypothetical protein
MPASLTRSRTGDVAVIALAREPSIRFLCRSLTTGAVFTDYPSLLIDLRHAEPIGSRTRDAVERATRECLTRRQLLGVVEPGEHVRRAIAQARRTRRLLHHETDASSTVLGGIVDVLAVFMRGADALMRESGRARVRTPTDPERAPPTHRTEAET